MVDLHVEERISPRILTNLMQNFRNAAEAIFGVNRILQQTAETADDGAAPEESAEVVAAAS